jgi:hypothetical protein
VSKLEHWLNIVAAVYVPEESADRFVDELLDRLGDQGAVLSVGAEGTLRRVDVTVVAATIGREALLELIEDAAGAAGADSIQARLVEEHAWAEHDDQRATS